MWNWLKSIIPTPKSLLKTAVDSLDLAEPYLAAEIDKLKGKFEKMSSMEQSKLVVDKIQAFLRKQFKLDVA